MALIAPDVCRYTINGSYLDRPVANIIDAVILDTIGPTGRNEAVERFCGVILNAWALHYLPVAPSAYRFDSVSWVDLNSESGSVGVRSSTDVYDLPLNGALAGQMYTGAVSVLVTKQTTAARGQRQGRWFLPPCTEADIEGNFIGADYLNALNDGLSDIVEALTDTGTIGDYQAFPTVVHTRNVGTPSNPDIVYVNNTQINSLTAQGRVSTQRRRNRR